jgi:hypothetical protein
MDFAYGQRYRDLDYKYWWWRVREAAILGVDCAIDQAIVCRRKPVDTTVQGRQECFRRTAGHN